MTDTGAITGTGTPRVGPAARLLALAMLLAAGCGVVTFLVRSDDGFDAEVQLVAESGGRISEHNRALAASWALQARTEFTDPPEGVDEVGVSVGFGSGLFEVWVRADTETLAEAHLGILVDLVLAASRDEEVQILESQIAEFDVALAGLDADSAEARRVVGEIEIRRGRLAVLTGLIQPAGASTVAPLDDNATRDGLVVALVVLVGVGAVVPRALSDDR